MPTVPPPTVPIKLPDEPPAEAGRSGVLPFDPLLLLATIGLAVCSLVSLAAATADDIPGDPNYYLYRQGTYFAVGAVLMVLLSRMDYSRLRELRIGLYAAMIALILLVIPLGYGARGSRRAIDFPFFSFQPSELGKLLLIVTLSGFVVDSVRRLQHRDTTARIMLFALVPALIVIAQPDLGTGLVYVVIALATLFVAGSSWRHFAALGALFAVTISFTLVAAPAAGVELLKPYQVDRLTAFLNPTEDPGDEGYQQTQSRIAVGAGQKTGRGAEEATQTKLNFLPEHHTDFIFAVVGERFGFVGAALVLLLYALLIWRGLRILTLAKNLYGALVAGGIVGATLFQMFVNIGMTIGIMPITGVPLPLMSYGGSSVLVTLMAIGLLQSIAGQAREVAAAKGRLAGY